MEKFKVAVAQMDSTEDIDGNFKKIEGFVKSAKSENAALVAFPENSNYVGLDHVFASCEIPGGYSFNKFSYLAKKYDIFIHCGSIYENCGGNIKNTSMVLDNNGNLIAKYHKIHPFDVDIKDGPSIRESDRIKPGDDIVLVDTKKYGKWGLSICYDLRFPEIFRIMAIQGTEIFFVPADFTLNTGKDHWSVLLRARSIENSCYTIAAAQIGKKARFDAYGKSMIIDPWGNIISCASEREDLIFANIDLSYVESVRNSIGSLKNRRGDIYDLRGMK